MRGGDIRDFAYEGGILAFRTCAFWGNASITIATYLSGLHNMGIRKKCAREEARNTES